MIDAHPAECPELHPGDTVVVCNGPRAGQVGEVGGVYRREVGGRNYEIVWVRFRDQSVDGFSPKSLTKKG